MSWYLRKNYRDDWIRLHYYENADRGRAGNLIRNEARQTLRPMTNGGYAIYLACHIEAEARRGAHDYVRSFAPFKFASPIVDKDEDDDVWDIYALTDSDALLSLPRLLEGLFRDFIYSVVVIGSRSDVVAPYDGGCDAVVFDAARRAGLEAEFRHLVPDEDDMPSR